MSTRRIVWLCVLFTACADSEPTPAPPDPVDEASPTTFPVQRIDETGRLVTLAGRLPLPATDDPAREVQEFLGRNAARLRLQPDLSDLTLVREVHDAGGTTYRYVQSHDGIPVFEGELVVGIDRGNTLVHLQSDYQPDLAVASTPTIGLATAIATAAARVGGFAGSPGGQLMIVRGDKTAPGHHLAYMIAGETTRPRGDWRVFVDATTNQVVRAIDMLKRSGAACIPCNPATDTGCGRLFDHNAVEVFDNTSLTDASNVDAAMTGCQLGNLTSSTNLTGTFANTSITAARVGPPYNFLRSANQNGVDEVDVYYHANRAKGRLTALGFPAVMNFSINIDAHDPTLGDNAHYVPSTKILEFGVGGVDDAQDPDVAYHEYGHAIQDNQVPGYGTTEEGGAAGEGFGDYWASALTDEFAATSLGTACVAAFDAVAYNPFTGTLGSGCLRRVDGSKQYPRDLDFEVHDDGEMWSAALWRLRTSVGGDVADAMIVKSHTFLTPSASFVDLATAVLSADAALFGGSHAATIDAAFIAQGIPRSGIAATVQGTPTTVNSVCETAHPYANNSFKECRFTQPGAQWMRVHFTQFNTESGFDFVRVSDAAYREVQVMSGTPFGGSGVGFSAAVTGDTIVVRFKADFTITRQGFRIDQFQYVLAGCQDDAACSDGNACNGAETCVASACVAGTPPNCNDSNACTTDSCAPATGCTHAAVTDGTSCADGNACNGGETCQVGACVPGAPLDCNDGDACTTDACNPATGCTTAPVNCDDGNACTNEACNVMTGCVAVPVTCNDGNACTADTCNPAAGCATAPLTCDDGDNCTTDGCNPATGCTTTPVACSDDGNSCTVELCTTNGCASVPVADGTPCTGAPGCGTPTCQAGACVASGTACDDGDACTVDTCDAQTSQCSSVPVACDDGNPCTVDTCDPATGCAHAAATDGTACGDGNACNGAETCQAGACAAGTPPVCDDGNPCTTDACNPSTGCGTTPVADGTTCGDADACNGDETCQAGACTAGVALNCDDGNSCATDTCSPVTGCTHSTVCSPQTIASDGFESNNYIGGTGWAAGWVKAGNVGIRSIIEGPHSGLRHVRLNNTSTSLYTANLRRSVDLAGVTDIHVRMWVKLDGFDPASVAFIQVSNNNGASFTTLQTFTSADSTNTYRFFDLPVAATFATSSFQVRILSAATNPDALMWVDDVEVFGSQ